MSCNLVSTVAVCLRAADGTTTPAVAHYMYGHTASGRPKIDATIITDATGLTVYDPAAFDSMSIGACPVEVERQVETIRGSGVLNLAPPFRSFSITAYSDDVVVNGSLVKLGQSISIDTDEFETYSNQISVAGSDYYITVTR